MSKPSARSKSARIQLGAVVRGRDAEFPSASMHVTGDARAKVIDIDTARQFEFGGIERNTLPERPSTSGGPAKRRNADKRETKDDLHFKPLGAHGSGTTFYNFPLPGSLHTQSNSPPAIRKSSLPRAETPDSMKPRTAGLNPPQMEIGMALGSPTHQPTDWQPQPPFASSSRNETPDSVDTYVDNDVHLVAPSKQKASKWKIFGGLFGGKKNAGSPQAFYQLQPEGAVVQTFGEADYNNFGEPVNSSVQSSKSRGQKNDKNKPKMKRAQTAPPNSDFLDSSRAKAMTGTPKITLDGGPLNVHPGGKLAHGGQMLNVDIPSVEMERYSVMFGSLLQNPTQSSSTLLARRQATLDRLKTVNEELALKEQELEAKAKQLRTRRATSPQPTKSPAFSLFPNTPSRLRDGSQSPDLRSRTLQRSNTSPAALSPSRPAFAPGPENETHANLMAPGPHVPMVLESQDKSTNSSKGDAKHSKHTPQVLAKPQPSSRNWAPEESHLTLSPTSDVEEDEDIYDPAPFPMKPKLDEPIWQIITPHHVPVPSVSGSTSSTSDHSTSTSASSISTTSVAPFAASNLKTVKIQAPPPKLRSRSGTTTSITAHPRQIDTEAPSSSRIPVAPSRRTGTEAPSTKIPIAHAPRKGSSASLASSPPSAPSARKQSLGGSSKHSEQKQTEHKPATQEDIDEQRLKTAADVSIARQISVSRQQRQLLIPIKASSNPNLKSKYAQNVPPLNTINMNHIASPLGAVASGSPVDRNGRPVAERKGSRSGPGGVVGVGERLIAASVKPSTPTLVVVGGSPGEEEKMWSGRSVERGSATSGEIRVGLAVRRDESRRGKSSLSPGEVTVHGHQHRKSERAVVERVGVVGSS